MESKPAKTTGPAVTLPEFSVRRPVTVFVTMVTIGIFGWLTARQLPIELLPDLAYPTLTVQTVYPDAAPVSVEQFVTRPIEESVGVIPGVREMHSVSRAGMSEVILEFDWSESMDFAAMEARDRAGLAELPREAGRPRVLRFDPSLDPIVRLALRGDRPLDELRRIAERWLKPRLEAVPGVAAAKVRGGLDPEIQVEADEDRLAALGLTLDDLAQALRQENVNRPGGTVKDFGAVYLVRTLHEFEDLEQLKRTVVRTVDDRIVRIEDVAEVRRGHRDRVEITRFDAQEVVELALHREGSANTVSVAQEIELELDRLRGELADDLSLVLLTDQSRYIEAAIRQVWTAGLFGGLIAMLVLYFFLRDLLATLIITLTIPISVIATFLPMQHAGVTLNIMSLGGLALGIGMLVDNSIVVLEAIDRYRRKGLSRIEAAGRGAGEVSAAVTAATLTTVCVFLPIVFVKGVAGQLFYDLAVTVCCSLVASLLVSLTLIPMLSSLDLKTLRRIETWKLLSGVAQPLHELPKGAIKVGPMIFMPLGESPGFVLRQLGYALFPLRLALRILLVGVFLYGLKAIVHSLIGAFLGLWWVVKPLLHFVFLPFTALLEGTHKLYPGLLRGALRWRWAVLPVAFGLFVTAAGLIPTLGIDLVPNLAQGEFAFRLKLAEGTPLQTTSEIVERVESRLTKDPRFRRVFSVVGSLPSTASGRRTLGENLAQLNLVLPEGTRAPAEQAAVQRVREVLALFPDVEAERVRPSVLKVQPPVVVHLFGEDLDDLETASAVVIAGLGRLAHLRDITTSSEPGNPEITIVLDRERAARLGVRVDPVSRSLRRQISGELVGQFREAEERLDIRLRAEERARDRVEAVSELRFRLDNGAILPLSAIADVRLGRGPASIHRTDGSRVVQITAEIEGGDLGGTLDTVREAIAGFDLPIGVVAEMGGQDEELRTSFDSLKLALSLGIFLVYVVMAVQFESLRYPLVILLSVPLGLVGVVAALGLTGTSISVLALLGGVMLAGIVVNNAIVLVDAIHRRRRAGAALDEAIQQAGAERLRPILMTTATTVFGLLPLALGIGAGDELRRPMAWTVIGGLTAATLLTLIVIPCLYRSMTRATTQDAGAPEPSGIAPGTISGGALP
ncbi:MAG: efflux RND transporter permease subunit [Acidobacteria bacterium]|nr:MAG: efflux RND transporter permease subunit [Acidobacteriota bacterium]